MNHQKAKLVRQLRRRNHVRRSVIGTAERPRLTVFRSSKHIYAQVIDDSQGVTLAAASTLETSLRGKPGSGGNCTGAELVGREIAQRALSRGITRVSYDRGPCRFHGRLAKLAEAARAAGLDF